MLDEDPHLPRGAFRMCCTRPLRWPPRPEFIEVTPRVFVEPGSNLIARFEDPSVPFHDIYSGLSFAPCGGQIVLASGNYTAPIALSRACGGTGIVPWNRAERREWAGDASKKVTRYDTVTKATATP
jgi:hypothetical protein